MLHLRSEVPIQSRPPVARSQIANRENVSAESLHENKVQNTIIPTHDMVATPEKQEISAPVQDISVLPSTSQHFVPPALVVPDKLPSVLRQTQVLRHKNSAH